jgi:hypothetical protein
MLPKDQTKLWDAAYAAARHNDVLDPKATTLMHLAVAAAVGCYP